MLQSRLCEIQSFAPPINGGLTKLIRCQILGVQNLVCLDVGYMVWPANEDKLADGGEAEMINEAAFAKTATCR